MAYKRTYNKRRRQLVDGGQTGIVYEQPIDNQLKSSTSGYDPRTELNTISQAPTEIESDMGGGYENDTTFEDVASYASLGTSFLNDATKSTASPQTAQDKYIYGQVQSADAGSSMEDLSYGITDMNPISSAFHDIGASANNLLAPTNELGYSDSINAAIAIGGAIDPGSTSDQAIQSFEEGNTLKGIGELLLPGYAAVNQNEEAKTVAESAQKEYAAQKTFDDNFNFFNTNQANQSRSGNTYSLRMGGRMSKAAGGDIQKEFIDGGKGTIYSGNTHEQGGIPLGNNTEVEGGGDGSKGEVKWGDYIFSDKINI